MYSLVLKTFKSLSGLQRIIISQVGQMHELHLLFLIPRLLCLCCVVTVKSFPVLAFNVVIITIVRIYTWNSFIALTSLLVSQIPHLRRFVIVVFPDHTHLLFLMPRLLCLCCVASVKSFPVLAFNVVIITIVRIYTWNSFIALTSLLVSQIPHLRRFVIVVFPDHTHLLFSTYYGPHHEKPWLCCSMIRAFVIRYL